MTKIVLLGDGGVGKTLFVNTMKGIRFSPKYVPTLGVSVNNNYGESEISYWDTAGQEIWGGLKDGYIIESDIVVIMFAVDSKLSFSSVKSYIQDAKRILRDNAPIILCGTKVDMPNRKVDLDMVKDLITKTEKMDYYFEISSKTGIGVQELNNYLTSLSSSLSGKN